MWDRLFAGWDDDPDEGGSQTSMYSHLRSEPSYRLDLIHYFTGTENNKDALAYQVAYLGHFPPIFEGEFASRHLTPFVRQVEPKIGYYIEQLNEEQNATTHISA